MGKIYQEGLGEVQEMIDICDFAVGQSRMLYGMTTHSERPDHRMFEQYHPLGIVGVISAFNFPVAVWAWNTMLAVVCGDTVLWKPSSKTMLCAIAVHNIMANVIKRNDLPEGLINLVAGSSKYIGDDFLADLSVRWEAEAARAGNGATRVVMLRTSVVLDPRGGALGAMLPIFRLGLGGPLGSGRQYFPWIHWRDVAGLIDLALGDDTLRGPINVVSPEEVTGRIFARTLGRVLHRPAVLPVPVVALRIMMGEMGRYMVASQRAVPTLAARHGYAFAFGCLQPALEDLLG